MAREQDGLRDYDVPIEVVMAQTQKVKKEMADAGEQFGKILSMMEACANNVRNCSLRADRIIFQPFFDALFGNRYVTIIGSKDETQIWQVTGIDGCGFYLRKADQPKGREVYVNVMERPDVAAKIRLTSKPAADQKSSSVSVSEDDIPNASSSSAS